MAAAMERKEARLREVQQQSDTMSRRSGWPVHVATWLHGASGVTVLCKLVREHTCVKVHIL